MKKLILIGMLLFLLPFVLADDCQIAHPIYGVVTCKGSTPLGYDEITETGTTSGEWFVIESTCNTDECELREESYIKSKNDQSVSGNDDPICGIFGALGIQIWVGVDTLVTYKSLGKWSVDAFPIQFSRDNQLIVKVQCCGLLGCDAADNPTIIVHKPKIWLYDHDQQHTSPIQVEDSVGCVPNSWMQSHSSLDLTQGSLPDSYYTTLGNSESKPNKYKTNSEIQNSFNSLKENMREGQTYSYLAGWQVIPDIGIIYGKNGIPSGYCGGSLGDRQLYSYEQITTGSGACYFIPTQIQRSVECCYNEDCQWFSTKTVCDPNSFTCTDQRPCNTDLECSPEGQTICRNKTETTWKCNSNKPWHPNKGTCGYTEKQVPCCVDSECDPEEYCNREEGCTSRVTILNCPKGKCCKEGGDYKPQECETGLECCAGLGVTVGECKTSCATTAATTSEEKQESSLPTGFAGVGTEDRGSGLLIPVIVLVAIVGIAIGGYYLHSRQPKQATVTQGVPPTSGPSCKSCGSGLKEGAKFCKNCGGNVD